MPDAPQCNISTWVRRVKSCWHHILLLLMAWLSHQGDFSLQVQASLINLTALDSLLHLSTQTNANRSPIDFR